MGNGLGYGHLAPLPLTVDSESINALLYLICEHNIEQVLHCELSPFIRTEHAGPDEVAIHRLLMTARLPSLSSITATVLRGL